MQPKFKNWKLMPEIISNKCIKNIDEKGIMRQECCSTRLKTDFRVDLAISVSTYVRINITIKIIKRPHTYVLLFDI